MDAEKLSLGGKVYVNIGVGPLRQELFMMMHARHAGLVGVAMLDGETPESFAARLLDMILCSGRALLLLGGVLVPEGKRAEDWTEDLAYETAAHLGSIGDTVGKQEVYKELLSLMLVFFVEGLGSWIASGRSSGADGGEAETETSPSASGDTGPDSSGHSRATIPGARSMSSAG